MYLQRFTVRQPSSYVSSDGRRRIWSLRVLIALACLLIAALVFMLTRSQAAPIPGNCEFLNCQHRYVEASNGVRIAVKQFGDADNPTILLTHGFSQSHLSWSSQLNELVAANFHVVAWDYPGHGDSDKPSNLSAYALPEVWAEYVQTIIDDLGKEKVCMVGHSFGGTVIEDYIFFKGADAVSGAVFVSSSHRFASTPPAHPRFILIASRLVDPELSVRLDATTQFVDMLTTEALSAEENAVISMYNMAARREALVGLLVNSGQKPDGYDIDVLNDLAKIPTLFIHGQLDEILPRETSQMAASLIRAKGSTDVQVLSFDGIGHSPQLENPTKFNEELAAFCR